MAKNSEINWTDHTFNPWIGCTKVSPGCKFCYAETFAGRYMNIRWGNHPRHITAASTWTQPMAWQRRAEKLGLQEKVFTASLSDIFEDRPELTTPRERLFDLIERTPNLTWLVLTKRLQDVERLLPERLKVFGFPKNIWLMTSICTQKEYNAFKPELDRLKSKYGITYTGISFEPLLQAINFHHGLAYWNIIGGESGFLKNTRPLEISWVKDLLVQSIIEQKAFWFKQTGTALAKKLRLSEKAGTDLEHLPVQLRYLNVRQFPTDLPQTQTPEPIQKQGSNQLSLF